MKEKIKTVAKTLGGIYLFFMIVGAKTDGERFAGLVLFIGYGFYFIQSNINKKHEEINKKLEWLITQERKRNHNLID